MRSFLLTALLLVPLVLVIVPTASACPHGPSLCVRPGGGCISYNVPVLGSEANGIHCTPPIEICRLDTSTIPPHFRCGP